MPPQTDLITRSLGLQVEHQLCTNEANGGHIVVTIVLTMLSHRKTHFTHNVVNLKGHDFDRLLNILLINILASKLAD